MKRLRGGFAGFAVICLKCVDEEFSTPTSNRPLSLEHARGRPFAKTVPLDGPAFISSPFKVGEDFRVPGDGGLLLQIRQVVNLSPAADLHEKDRCIGLESSSLSPVIIAYPDEVSSGAVLCQERTGVSMCILGQEANYQRMVPTEEFREFEIGIDQSF